MPTGMIRTCTGASQSGNVAAVVLDDDPDEALERTEERAVNDDAGCSRVVGPMYVSPNRAGIWRSSWIVPSCHERPSASVMWRSIFGP